jgi:hypothetical protein
VARDAAQDEQVRQHVDHVGRLELAPHPDRQALTGKLIDHVQHSDLAAVAGAVFHEVIGPDGVGPLRPQPHARAVRQPEPATLGLPAGTFSPSARQIRSTRL